WRRCCAGSSCACTMPASPPSASGSRIFSCSPTAATAPSASRPYWTACARRSSPASTEKADMARKRPNTEQLQAIIEDAFERRAALTAAEIEGSTRPAVEEAIELLESGKARVAVPGARGWEVNPWLKKAVLLYFRVNDMHLVEAYPAPFWDKVPQRFQGFDEPDFQKVGARVVPGAIIRAGAHIGKDVVLMPSFVNIGAYVGAGTMVDTWATIGSCAQVGRNCHISGGAGIGGVLEPLQASPTIIE